MSLISNLFLLDKDISLNYLNKNFKSHYNKTRKIGKLPFKSINIYIKDKYSKKWLLEFHNYCFPNHVEQYNLMNISQNYSNSYKDLRGLVSVLPKITKVISLTYSLTRKELQHIVNNSYNAEYLVFNTWVFETGNSNFVFIKEF